MVLLYSVADTNSTYTYFQRTVHIINVIMNHGDGFRMRRAWVAPADDGDDVAMMVMLIYYV